MKKLIFIIALLSSIVLYLYAPIQYNRDFCILCLVIFSTIAAIIINDDTKKIGFINFNTLFLSSFFVCSYVYPVFLIGHKSIIGILIERDLTTFNTINRCVALCTLAICTYGYQYISHRKNRSSRCRLSYNGVEVYNLLKVSKYAIIALSISMVIVLIRFLGAEHEVNIEVNDAPYLFQFFYFMMPLYLACSAMAYKTKMRKKASIRKIFKENKLIIILLFVLIFLFLYIGDRAPLMTIAIAIIATITLYIKKIKPIWLIGIGLLGILLMFALRVTRGGESSLNEGGMSVFLEATQTSIADNASVWDLLSDLVGINMELNAGMDYVDRNGNLETGANFLVAITAPIPLLPSLLTSFFYGKQPIEVNSGTAIGLYTNSAAGNHCVIDIFMPFGIVGVIVAFFILGWGIAKLTNGLRDKMFCKIFYIYILSTAIFLARNSLINVYRAIVLSYIIYLLLLWISKINSKKEMISHN